MSGTWQAAHYRAVATPNRVEEPFSHLTSAITEMLDLGYGQDGFLREGLALVLRGTLRLLNADLGRLDGGTLDAFLREAAAAMNFDLDTETFMPAAER